MIRAVRVGLAAFAVVLSAPIALTAPAGAAPSAGVTSVALARSGSAARPSAAGLPAQTTDTTTDQSTTTAPSTTTPATTTAPTTATTAPPTTTASPTTTVPENGARSTTATTGGATADRGVIHQVLRNAGTSEETAHSAQIYLAAPIRVFIILIVALVLSRLVDRIARRLVNGMRLVSPLVQGTPRGAARVQTLAGAFASVFRALVWVIALLEILGQFSINLAPFIATATVIGAAVGFGAQSLVKDFLSGVLILAEDQYGVGDHVAIGTGPNQTSGVVESVNLRVTRLRGADGGILYVPNGDIRTLSNDTETDSQALVDVMVPFGTDLVAAGVAAQEAARDLAVDPEWSGEFVSEPFFAGVQDATSVNGPVLRIMALTRPGQHLRMAREMRMRVMEKLRGERIAWAPDGADPPELPPDTEVRKARAEQRQAEHAAAEKISRSASGASKRSRSTRPAVRKRGAAPAEPRSEPNGPPEEPGGPGPGDSPGGPGSGDNPAEGV
jgi:small conductance mechanosensitive channel